MIKLKSILVLAVLIAGIISGCASPAIEPTGKPAESQTPIIESKIPAESQTPIIESKIPADNPTPPDTEFAHMLGLVPYSFLEEHDIWFDNWKKAKEIHGIEEITSFTDLTGLSEEKRAILQTAWGEITGNIWRNSQLSTFLGYDVMLIDRMVFVDIPPPWVFTVSEAEFDEEFITGKLLEYRYEAVEYGTSTYYTKGYDFELDFGNELAREVMATMNRVAVLDNTIATAPATDILTGILDTMTGDSPSIIENTVCSALADSLGDVLTAVITIPERIITTSPAMEDTAKFNFIVPDDWGFLHGYEMAALGNMAEGEKRFLVISLFYKDMETARADNDELVKRINSYTLGTIHESVPDTPFTDMFDLTESRLIEHGNGVVLKISCRLMPEGRIGTSSQMGAYAPRDLLFLAPDPSVYIGKNEPPPITTSKSP